MDGSTFLADLEAEYRSELDRLGSSKLLVALTDAELTERVVLETAAHSEYTARETFRAWAADESDERARAAFERAANQEAEHYDRVVAELGTAVEPSEPGAMHAFLLDRAGTAERIAAGMIARSTLSLRVHAQIVSFFVNEADEARAELFRDLRAETDETLEAGVDLLGSIATDADREALLGTAGYVIQVAYDEYADALTALDIDPKPVC